MAKSKTVYVCSECGYETGRWLGRCPECGNWNTLQEEMRQPEAKGPEKKLKRAPGSGAEALRIDEIPDDASQRRLCGIAELDRVLGGGVVDGSVVLFPALVVLVVLPEYFRPIREFASDYHASLDGKNSLVSLMRLAKAKTAPKSELDATILPWTAEAKITFSQVGFAYEERQADGSTKAHETLHGVSFSVRGFKKVGIVGPSGGGKTTLVNLLAGFAAPTEAS